MMTPADLHVGDIGWKPPACGIDRLVDDATGADRAFIESFIRWANVNVWGPIDAEAQP